ncbi:glycosyltransferase [Flavobacterium sp.]|uniref:glycosyltransferase n=1 Tax=Flavobacterium sp. TaxID=239 RepID=UPI002622140B|nr:glycosyltransferase [Flavobacterium sp.]
MIAAILISYVAVMFVFLRKRTKKHEQTNPEQALPLSVLIPFRGSVSELSSLLNDLNNQDYPLENVEVLIVNDSEQPLHLATESFRFSLQIIDSLARKGKKAAIDLGVSTAKNEHILSLDADVRLKATHLSGFSQAFATENDLVVGVLHFNELPKNFSNYFEYYEYYGMQAVTQASVLFGNSLLCSGANLGFTKATYVKTRAIRTDFELESGDDMFLLQAAKKSKFKIGLASGRSSSALLNYQTNLQAVLAQRIRWGAKSVVYKDVSVLAFTLLVAAAVWAQVWVLSALLFGKKMHVELVLILAKIAIDFLLVCKHASVIGQRPSLRVDVVLAYPFITAYLSLRALVGKTTWKNRSISR